MRTLNLRSTRSERQFPRIVREADSIPLIIFVSLVVGSARTRNDENVVIHVRRQLPNIRWIGSGHKSVDDDDSLSPSI